MDPTNFSIYVGPKKDPIQITQTTGPNTQLSLPESPEYTEPAPTKLPSWGDRFLQVAKKAGLITGAVLCASLALGLLPLTILGSLLAAGGVKKLSTSYNESYKEGKPLPQMQEAFQKEAAKAERMAKIGMILAAPLVGFSKCIGDLTIGRKA